MRPLLFLLLLAFPLLARAQFDTTSISGHVSVKRGEASAEGIFVTMRGPYTFPKNYYSRNYYTTTDSAGYYSFHGLYNGTYYISYIPDWDKCFHSDVLTDTIEIKHAEAVVHDFLLDELSSDRDWMPDTGTATITTHLIDVKTGRPANVSIDILRLDPGPSGMKYTMISQYQARTDSTGMFTSPNYCHGIYELRYYYYVDGRRDYVGRDSLYLMPDEKAELKRYLDIPVSVRPTNTLPVANINFHIGIHPTAELAFGVGHVVAEHKLTSYWETAQAGCEFGFSHNQLIIGPKLTYNYSAAFIMFGLIGGGSLIYYTNFTNSNLFLHPQFGVTIQTIFDIYIGGNIPLHYLPFNSSVNTFTLTLAIEIVNRKRLDL